MESNPPSDGSYVEFLLEGHDTDPCPIHGDHAVIENVTESPCDRAALARSFRPPWFDASSNKLVDSSVHLSSLTDRSLKPVLLFLRCDRPKV